MNTRNLAALLALVLSCLPAAAAEYVRLLPERSQISFVSRQLGVPVEGRFRKFDAALAIDPTRPEAAKAAVDIDLASIDVGSKEAYDEVIGKNWFNVRQHPTARFVASTIRATGPGRFEARGQLAIKGRSRELVAPVSLRQDGANGVFEGVFVFKRLDYGVGEGAWGDPDTVADEVQVKFRLVAAPAASK